MPPKAAAGAAAATPAQMFAAVVADPKRRRALQSRVLTWFHENQRALPWRACTVITDTNTAAHREMIATLQRMHAHFEASLAGNKQGAAAAAAASSKKKQDNLPVAREHSQRLIDLFNNGVPAADNTDDNKKGGKRDQGSNNAAALPLRVVTPYHILVSEVMSQQTRIEVVVPFWIRWIQRFPTPQALASASLDEVNAFWSGLGFYRRAANLHKGAEHIVQHCGGAVPGTIAQLLKVPSIGPYGAGAVGSIAFNVEEPAVDGNVIRVLARLYGMRGCDPKAKETAVAVTQRARDMIGGVAALPPTGKAEDDDDDGDKKRKKKAGKSSSCGTAAGNWNQALMEIGATVCLPAAAPKCAQCPFSAVCAAKQMLDRGDIEEIFKTIPLVAVAGAKTAVSALCVVVSRAASTNASGDAKEVAIFQRPAAGPKNRTLLKGFWSFPMVPLASLAAFQRKTAFTSEAALRKLVKDSFTAAKKRADSGTAADSFNVKDSIEFVLNILNNDDDDDELGGAIKVSMPSALNGDDAKSAQHVKHIFSHIDFTAVVVHIELPHHAPAKKGAKKKVAADPFALGGTTTTAWQPLSELRSSASQRAISNLDEKILRAAAVPGADRRRARKAADSESGSDEGSD